MNKRVAKGFTLIELMIVVAVVAILASIAYPSYVDQVRKSRRAEAQSLMLEDAQWLERQFTANSSYMDVSVDPPVVPTLPIDQSPRDGTARYNIGVAATATTFTLTATPQGDQTNDRCGTMTVDQTGARTPAVPAECW
ncbi:MAG: type IV pilin protein [Gammaproteobacteria bacterium]|nr:type IV pilin protein [Gammaproteobacteria bacterium]